MQRWVGVSGTPRVWVRDNVWVKGRLRFDIGLGFEMELALEKGLLFVLLLRAFEMGCFWVAVRVTFGVGLGYRDGFVVRDVMLMLM